MPAAELAVDDALLTPAIVAAKLAVSRSMVYALIRAGKIGAIYVGALPRIRQTELARYVSGLRSTRLDVDIPSRARRGA